MEKDVSFCLIELLFWRNSEENYQLTELEKSQPVCFPSSMMKRLH